MDNTRKDHTPLSIGLYIGCEKSLPPTLRRKPLYDRQGVLKATTSQDPEDVATVQQPDEYLLAMPEIPVEADPASHFSLHTICHSWPHLDLTHPRESAAAKISVA